MVGRPPAGGCAVTGHRIVADRFLGSVCAACRGQGDMLAIYDLLEDGTPGECPGPPAGIGGIAVLPGTPPPDAGGNLPVVSSWSPERCHHEGHG